MQLGYNTWSMPTLPIDTTLRHLARLGFDSFELTVCPGWTTDADTLDAAGRRHIRALIAATGLRLSGMTGNTPILVPDDTWDRNYATLLRYLDLAASFRTAADRLYVATTSGLPDGADPVSAWAPNRECLAERFGRLAEAAAQRNVVLHLEPHVATAVRRPEQALWLLDQVGSPAFRLSLDISHFEVQGDDHRDIVRRLATHAGAVEVKDQRGLWPDFAFLVPGEGAMDYARFLRALADTGFSGSVSVEISKFRQADPAYDPLAAAAASYRVLAAAFERAEVPRPPSPTRFAENKLAIPPNQD